MRGVLPQKAQIYDLLLGRLSLCQLSSMGDWRLPENLTYSYFSSLTGFKRSLMLLFPVYVLALPSFPVLTQLIHYKFIIFAQTNAKTVLAGDKTKIKQVLPKSQQPSPTFHASQNLGRTMVMKFLQTIF